jgi:hypothetical protein
MAPQGEWNLGETSAEFGTPVSIFGDHLSFGDSMQAGFFSFSSSVTFSLSCSDQTAHRMCTQISFRAHEISVRGPK